ncbi:MAG TPA: LL-diaminopimelate aminotransferase [Candidatus Gemmiger stercoripullorum]|nr:LL-diaminopimelate aminotransferase [Candidatus Gemmiger stercoripullorum]
MKVNKHYQELEESYLFSTIAHKVADYQAAHPDADIIRLGIGDVTLPLAKSVVQALHEASDEQGRKETFHGYIPSEQGYPFLREAIQRYYAGRGVALDTAEIFISDGAKSDLGNLLDLFDADNTVLVPDPVYPVYVDDNVMAGRRITYMPASAENHFLPMPDENTKADIVYLCSPNNPTGATYTRSQLKVWVDWANAHDAVILFDAAYECFVSEEGLARSIYEVEGAKTCAIEVCSFSKIAGFTGTRCGYTIVPQALARDGMNLNKMWLRRQTTKFNGVAYIVQRAAAAVFSEDGMREIQQNLDYYRRNAAVIAAALDEAGVWYCGGKNSPYIWLECPAGMGSWQFFDWLLDTAHVVGTPGEGFGRCGEGYFRLTAFGDAERTKEAAARILAALKTLG